MVSSEAWCESMSRAEWPDFTQVKCTTVFNCFYESFVNKEINTTHFPLTWNWSSHLPHGNNQNYRQLISTQSTLTQAEEGGLISCRPGTIISPQSDGHLKNTTYVDVHHGWMWITERRLKMWAATAGERTSMEKVNLYRVLGTEGARHAAQVSVAGPNRVLSSCSCLCVGLFFLKFSLHEQLQSPLQASSRHCLGAEDSLFPPSAVGRATRWLPTATPTKTTVPC